MVLVIKLIKSVENVNVILRFQLSLLVITIVLTICTIHKVKVI